MRKQSCPACNALKNGIKSRKAFEHIGCEFDRHSIPLQNVTGHATVIGNPDTDIIDALNKMADLAYKTIDDNKPLKPYTI